MTDAACLTKAEARAFYDRFGSKQDGQAFYEDAAVQDLVAHAAFEEASAVFEFGCGTGRFAERLLATHLSPTARYVGCDISMTMISLARSRLARFGDRAEVHWTDGAPRIDAADAICDRVVSNYVLDLLSPADIDGVVSEAHRVITPAGRLCLTSLTRGTTRISRAVIWVWTRLHHWRPQLVGGCRPLVLRDHLPAQDWRIAHRNVVVAYGMPSEIVVAQKR